MQITSHTPASFARSAAQPLQPQATSSSFGQDGFVSGPRTLVEPPPPGYNPNAPLPRAWTVTAGVLGGGLLGAVAGGLLTQSGTGAAALALVGAAGLGYAAFRATA